MKTNLLRYALALATCFAVSGMAQAQDWKVVGEFGWFGVGKAHQIEKGHFYWVASSAGPSSMTRAKAAHFIMQE